MKVATPEQAEATDYLVCMRKQDIRIDLPGNLMGHCSECGAEIVYGPSVPQRPKKICTRCFTLPADEKAEFYRLPDSFN
jgi:hypothetical protein